MQQPAIANNDRSTVLDNLAGSSQPTLSVGESSLTHLEKTTSSSPPPYNYSFAPFAATQNRSMDAPRKADINSTFCENILAELQDLSDVDAYRLRRALNRTMWNFLDCKHPEKI